MKTVMVTGGSFRVVVIVCDKRKAFAQGSDSDEAIQNPSVVRLDCFADARNDEFHVYDTTRLIGVNASATIEQ
jgi:hypothetical protein